MWNGLLFTGLTVLVGLHQRVAAQEVAGNNSFTNPPNVDSEEYIEGLNYTVGSSINITWIAANSPVRIGIYKGLINGYTGYDDHPYFHYFSNNSIATQGTTGLLPWSVTLNCWDLDPPVVYTPRDDEYFGFVLNYTLGYTWSQPFQIIHKPETTSSSTSSTPTSFATTSSASTYPTAEPTTTPDATIQAQSATSTAASVGLSQPAKIGVGVGVGLGLGLALIGLGVFQLLRRQRRIRGEHQGAYSTPQKTGEMEYVQEEAGNQYR